MRIRAIVIGVALLVVLAVVADRLAVSYADHQVGVAIRQGEGLSTNPSVKVRGFPFLTQFVHGRYGRVDVHVQGLTKGGLTVSRVDAHLHGVRVPFWDVVRKQVHRVTINRIDGSVLITYSELSAAVGHGVSYAYSGPGVVKIGAVGASVTARVSLQGSDIVIAPATGSVGAADLPLPHLPFHLTLQSVSVTPGGVRVVAMARSVVVTVAS